MKRFFLAGTLSCMVWFAAQAVADAQGHGRGGGGGHGGHGAYHGGHYGGHQGGHHNGGFYISTPFLSFGTGGHGWGYGGYYRPWGGAYLGPRYSSPGYYYDSYPSYYYSSPSYYSPGYSSGYYDPAPSASTTPPPPEVHYYVPPPATPAEVETPPPPREKALPKSVAPPVPDASGAVRVEDFVKTFKPRAGSYELDLVNPVTGRPTNVRFALPEGTPRSVDHRDNVIEFRYGPSQFVRIEFDKEGALVTSR